jgi:HD-GYP domain-containing protein (c-di-GMP phosphodiesterase class II)
MKYRARLPISAAVIALLVLVGIGAALINAYIKQEKQRDLLQWDSRLGLVADGKADAIYRLLSADRRNLDELAANASLRFYLWEIGQPGATPDARGALGYLRNLVLAAAERYGYVAAGADTRVAANVSQPRTAGLAILDAELRPVVATPGLLDVTTTYGSIARRALSQPADRSAVLVPDSQGQPVIVLAAPISTVPGAGAAGGMQAVGVLLGIRSAEEELFPLLSRGPSFPEESEALLLERRADGTVALLSPTRDGSPALRRTLPAGRADLAEAAAVASPGGFVVGSNYRGVEVLQVSRPVRDQSWVVAQQVDAAQALSLANERRGFLLAVMSLLLLSVVAVAVAAWRHGSSVRAEHHASELADKAARLERQTGLLHTVTDSIDVLTILVTRDDRVLFTNQATADEARLVIAAILGRPLAGFLPPTIATGLQEGIERMRREGGASHALLQWPGEGEPRDFHVSFIPVERIGEERDLALLVLSDVTDLRKMQERHAGLLRRLVTTLAAAVDRRDPHAAHHAERVTEVTDAVARELGFGDREREALGLAASLANIGKIMIPTEILTKTEPLTAAERELVQRHVDYGLELLEGLQFEGPVTDIIAEKQERPDGRGYPLGVDGDRITQAGQILAVANAFVALVSGRAYKAGMSVESALDELMSTAGLQFDRHVLAALFHVAENRRDWSQWG